MSAPQIRRSGIDQASAEARAESAATVRKAARNAPRISASASAARPQLPTLLPTRRAPMQRQAGMRMYRWPALWCSPAAVLALAPVLASAQAQDAVGRAWLK